MRSWDSMDENQQHLLGFPKHKKVLFVINISLGKDKSDRLPVYQGEDPKQEVSKFCTRNRLKEKEVGPRILKQVEDQLKKYNEQQQPAGIAIGFQGSASNTPKASETIGKNKKASGGDIAKLKVPDTKMLSSDKEKPKNGQKLDLSNFYSRTQSISSHRSSGRPGSPPVSSTQSSEYGIVERESHKKILKQVGPVSPD